MHLLRPARVLRTIGRQAPPPGARRHDRREPSGAAAGTTPQPKDGGFHAFSVAIMAGIACLPIVIAVGFLTDNADRPAVSTASLRGPFDADERSDASHIASERVPVRAGF